MRILICLALVLSLTAGASEAPGRDIVGIGAVLVVEDHNIVVKEILPSSPAAAQGGIHAGDRIVAVAQDEEPAVQVQGGKLAHAIALIRGPKGTTVRLTIVPAGEDDSHAQVVSFVRGELKGIVADDAPPRHAAPASNHRLVVGAAVSVLAGAGLLFCFRRKSR